MAIDSQTRTVDAVTRLCYYQGASAATVSTLALETRLDLIKLIKPFLDSGFGSSGRWLKMIRI
jgi:hypothetical protein